MKETCGNCRYLGKGTLWTIPMWEEQESKGYEGTMCFANPPASNRRVNQRPKVEPGDIACRFWASKKIEPEKLARKVAVRDLE